MSFMEAEETRDALRRAEGRALAQSSARKVEELELAARERLREQHAAKTRWLFAKTALLEESGALRFVAHAFQDASKEVLSALLQAPVPTCLAELERTTHLTDWMQMVNERAASAVAPMPLPEESASLSPGRSSPLSSPVSGARSPSASKPPRREVEWLGEALASWAVFTAQLVRDHRQVLHRREQGGASVRGLIAAGRNLAKHAKRALQQLDALGLHVANGKQLRCEKVQKKVRTNAGKRGADNLSNACLVWGGDFASLNEEVLALRHALSSWKVLAADEGASWAPLRAQSQPR